MASVPGSEDKFVLPSRRSAAWFAVRASGLRLLRAVEDLFDPEVRRTGKSGQLAYAPILAQVVSSLWDDGRSDEFPLLAGKVENLRRAVAAFDGRELRSGQMLSFWAQIGPPWRLRGFVAGREIREGCVVPAIAGGLCQLSNALALAAERAGLTVVERHAHTARIEEAGPGDLDATVFWNYVDLRLRAGFPCRIEAQLSADNLQVVIRGELAAPVPERRAERAPSLPRDAARGCLTCEEKACFRHGRHDRLPRSGRTALLLGEAIPEFTALVRARWPDADRCEPWLRPGRSDAAGWTLAGAPLSRPLWPGLRRIALLRFNSAGGQRQAAILKSDGWRAQAYARRLRPEHVELVVDQSLLVPLHRLGALGGRRYTVLANALPAGEIQRRLDAALEARPDAHSLADFRADPRWIATEEEALRGAQGIVTPHAAAAAYLEERNFPPVERLDWIRPLSGKRPPQSARDLPVIGFPASSLARKGACEVAEAARVLGWPVMIGGGMLGNDNLWSGVEHSTRPASDPDWLDSVDIVVLPAHVEHSPRMALKALVAGIPVIASDACGLPPKAGHIDVPAGNTAALVEACKFAASRSGLRQALDGASPAPRSRENFQALPACDSGLPSI